MAPRLAAPRLLPRRPGLLLVISLLAPAASGLTASGEPVAVVQDAAARMSAERLAAIEPLLVRALNEGQFCGCVVAIGRRQGIAWQRTLGRRQVEPRRRLMQPDAVFDLASLTKPIATATSVMLLMERGKLRLSDKACKYLPELDREGTRDITIELLLIHGAGFVPDNPIADYQEGAEAAWRRLLSLDPVEPPGSKFIYSDVGYELLGKLIERVDGRPLDRFAAEEVFAPLGMRDTGFRPGAELRSRAVATERRDGRWLIGEVHDPRAALLGGVAGHAGLFSTAADLARFAQMMLGRGELEGVRVLGDRTVAEMCRPRVIAGVRRAAGWDSRSPYSRNRGDLFSDTAIGHGGFTGTTFWVDPGLDLFVILLSSRLHPDGEGAVNDLAGRIGTIAAAAIHRPDT